MYVTIVALQYALRHGRFASALTFLIALLLLSAAVLPRLTYAESFNMQWSESPSADYEQKRTMTQLKWPDFKATGLYVPAGSVVEVFVEADRPVSGNLALVVGTYQRKVFALRAGNNALSLGDAQGMVFVRYVKDSPPFGTNPVKLTFRQGFQQAPRYVLGKTNRAQWQASLNELSNVPEVLLESRRALLVYSREHALAWLNNDQDIVLQSIDVVLDAEDALSGLDGSSELHRPIAGQMLMVEVPGDTMPKGAGAFATNFYTAFSQRTHTMEAAFTPLLLEKGWGTYHELGHTHQQTWTWPAITEVSVNIFSLAARRALQPSEASADMDEKNEEREWRAQEFIALKDPAKDYNDSSLKPFTRLQMFRQLWIVYGDKIFVNLHRMVREEKPEFHSTQERMAYFMRKTCQISGEDLSVFFKNWGFRVDPSVYDGMKAMHLPTPKREPSAVFSNREN